MKHLVIFAAALILTGASAMGAYLVDDDGYAYELSDPVYLGDMWLFRVKCYDLSSGTPYFILSGYLFSSTRFNNVKIVTFTTFDNRGRNLEGYYTSPSGFDMAGCSERDYWWTRMSYQKPSFSGAGRQGDVEDSTPNFKK